MLRPSALFTALVASLLAGHAAQAAGPNLLVNGSFEEGAWALNTGSGWMDVALASTAITGWTLANNHVAWSAPGNADGIGAFDGNHSLDLTGMGNISPNGAITQSIATVIGQTYTLSFYLEAVVGYGVPADVQVQAGSATQTYSKNTNGWQAYSLDFVAAGSSTAITLSGVRSPNTYYIGLDNVSVTAAVPEPQTYALMLAGLALVGVAARRQAASTL